MSNDKRMNMADFLSTQSMETDVQSMGITEFLNPAEFRGSQNNIVCNFINTQEHVRSRAPVQERVDYNHGMSSGGPPLPGVNIIVPGQAPPPFHGPPVVCGPPLHNGQRPPMAPPGSLTHPPPIPPHHHPVMHHGPPPPHIPSLPLPPGHHYGPIEPGHLPPPPGSHVMQTSLPPPLPPGPVIPRPQQSGPPPYPHTQSGLPQPPLPGTQSTPPPLPPPSTQSMLPPPLPHSHSVPPPLPPPLPPDKVQMPPPLPPLPPLPPSVSNEHSKPPLPKGPPPSSIPANHSSPSPYMKPIKSLAEVGRSVSSKERHLSRFKTIKNNRYFDEEPKPIPSIVTSGKPISVHTSSSNSRRPYRKDSTPPPPPLPISLAKSTPMDHSGNISRMPEEVYDPEDATFSPASSNGSPQEENSVISPVKSVRYPVRPPPPDHRSVKYHDKNEKDRKKKVSFSKDVSFTEKSDKSPVESPVRPNLDTRLRLMFGGMSDEEKSPKKSKKSGSKPNPPQNSLRTKEEDDETRPLSPTPSPFLSRNLYLYWHKETLKARKPGTVDLATVKVCSDQGKPKHNGQAPTAGRPSLIGIPPLPKNLPTVPPPNYKSTLAEPPAMKEGNFKVEMLKNIKRMHPYKVYESKVTCLKNSMDTEFELTSIAPSDSLDEKFSDIDDSESQEETVRLVMAKIVDDLKSIIRQEVTKELIDRKVYECLKNK